MSKAFGGEREKERREQILAAAAECVAEGGIDGATLKRVAERAKVSTGMIAYYFKDKNDLMIETFRGRAAKFRQRLTDQAGPGPDLDRLLKVFELSFPQSGPSGWPFWLEFSAHAARNPELLPQHMERINTVREDMRNCLAQAVGANDTAAASNPPDVLGDLFLALYYGFGALSAAGGDVMPPERVERVLDLVMSALGLDVDVLRSSAPANSSRRS